MLRKYSLFSKVPFDSVRFCSQKFKNIAAYKESQTVASVHCSGSLRPHLVPLLLMGSRPAATQLGQAAMCYLGVRQNSRGPDFPLQEQVCHKAGYLAFSFNFKCGFWHTTEMNEALACQNPFCLSEAPFFPSEACWPNICFGTFQLPVFLLPVQDGLF